MLRTRSYTSRTFPMEGKPSPRRELQGPRPAALKVRKDSHKIKKPARPLGASVQLPLQPPPPPRQPIIIYTVSPKVIHAEASEFMSLVQRLTGNSVSSSSSSSSCSTSAPVGSDGLSSAARMASIEKANAGRAEDTARVDLFNVATSSDRGGLFPWILSPAPLAPPQTSPNFFSPMADPNLLSFLHELSPAFHGSQSYIESSFMTSPTTDFFSTNNITSPTPPFDPSNHYFQGL